MNGTTFKSAIDFMILIMASKELLQFCAKGPKMDSSTYYPLFRYFLGTPNITSAGNIWLSGPTEEGRKNILFILLILMSF